MDYKTIEKQTAGKTFPVMGSNENDELVVIVPGKDEAGNFFKVNTCQSNGWIRTNLFYENGDTCESYHRSLK
ncbi:MAG: hypothetical protein IKN04_11070 [Clostridia bacterium]|nr:hypothetical protein [Clostridia bacterium]